MNDSNENFENDLRKALKVLMEGGIILYPTDTIWGIGCDARNSKAVKKIFDLKKRSDSKSMLVLVNDIPALEKVIDEIPEVGYEILDAAVEPLTVILDGAMNVAPELIAEDGSLGIRITKEEFSNKLCHLLRSPLVSTSANISGDKSPAFFREISEEIKNGVDYIVSYRQDDEKPKKPSNIIKLGKGGEIKIIR